ncbi:MAG TPA: UDP-N-acetylmuramoyl-tripeptide--D-alanyl-D-alanine ligase [Verrucomicrobiae bacterium]|jgi:UDP-N-acetylmuramoyl-tripeptide--D-alanyl-D-alanine ligase|nr:UDP-N-acetylmuramoyl-tripeptide--D-alanyl-D-alanine ligase [Verrucomicrobiae bacterium]
MEPRTLKYVAEAMQGEVRGGAADALARRICTDSRQAEPGDLFVALAGERFDAHRFLAEVAKRGVAAVVAERGKLPADFAGCPVIVVENTRRALGRLSARYRRDFDLPIVAVGGSNGKTTTKELIASVLRQKKPTLWSEASFNNDVGVPLTLLRLESAHQAAVLETGTNHPGELAPLLQWIQPCYGVITSIGREHLEFFGDLAGVAQEEGAMAEALPKNGALFLPGDSAWAEAIAARTSARVVRVGTGEHNEFRVAGIHVDELGTTFRLRTPRAEWDGDYRIQLLGRHQAVNAALAVAVAAELGLERGQITRGLAACAPAKWRMQLLTLSGVRLLADAYNANADSMLAALQALCDLPCAGRRVAALGDMAELGEGAAAAHAEVGQRAAEARLDKLFAVGVRAGDIAAAARRGGLTGVVELAEVEAAAQAVRDYARPGDLVLVKASRAMRLERIIEVFGRPDGSQH